MAATVTSAWAKPGAWALDSEQHEDELNKQQDKVSSTAAPISDFPDLMTAAATKTKKKKAQTLSLGEFVSNQSYQANKGLTGEELINLPTGPRQRTAEELERSRLGGGFIRSYGERNNESRWGSNNRNNNNNNNNNNNGGDEEGRRGSREVLGPSRADEIDDWGAAKKVGGGFERRGGSGGGFEGLGSRADESESWGANKTFRPSEGRKFGGFDRERRMGFESSGDADSSDNWGKKKEVERPRFGGGSGSAFDSLRERQFGNESSDSDNWGRKREESGGGRPKLNLQPRKLPVGEVESVKVKGSNPFGEARPREEVLKEKGEDWKEIDEKLEAMKMKDSGSGDRFKRGGGKPRLVEDLSEKSWRKNQADVSTSSGENNENGHTEEPEPEEGAQK